MQHRLLIYPIVIILLISGKNSKQKTVNATKVECGDQEMCQEGGGMSLMNTQCPEGSRQPMSMAHAARGWRKRPSTPIVLLLLCLSTSPYSSCRGWPSQTLGSYLLQQLLSVSVNTELRDNYPITSTLQEGPAQTHTQRWSGDKRLKV